MITIEEKIKLAEEAGLYVYGQLPSDHTHRDVIKPGHMVEVFAWDDGKVYE